MTQEKHDPWALLRDAQEFLGHGLPCTTVCGECIVAARIDDALAEGCPDCGHQYGQQEYCQGDGHAEHADSAQSAVESEVEWTQDALGHYARVKVEAEIEVFQDLSGEWQWNRTALSDVRRHGSANTLDEAKSAAIAAARGMK